MYQPILSMHTWLSLPSETKAELRRIFFIPRSGHVEVNDGKIFCDGTMMEDLMHLTLEKMQVYLDTTSEDFNLLFNMVIESIQKKKEELKEQPIQNDTETAKTEQIEEGSSKRPRGRKRSKS